MLVIVTAILQPASAQIDTIDEPEQYYQQFVDLYSGPALNRGDLTEGRNLLENANEIAPDTLVYARSLGLANSMLGDWDESVRWLSKSLNLVVDPIHRQRIQLELDYSKVQQSMQPAQIQQELTYFSVTESEQLDLNSINVDTMPQRVSNIATRASHETAESILRKSLNRHQLDSFQTDSFLLVTVDESITAESHFNNGIRDIFTFLNEEYSISLSSSSLTIMILPDKEIMQSVARRIYPSLNITASTSINGFYNPADHLLMATVDAGNYGILIHQLVHALLYTNSSTTPSWFIEAMAILYQNSTWQADHLRPILKPSVLQPDDIATLSTLTGQINSLTVEPNSSEIQLLLYFLLQKEKLRALLYELQYQSGNLQHNNVFAALQIDESVWRQFLTQTLSRVNSVPYEEFKTNLITVQYIQQALNETLDIALIVDGQWGPATDRAIKKFQQASELVADGVPGPRTMQQLSLQYSLAALLP